MCNTGWTEMAGSASEFVGAVGRDELTEQRLCDVVVVVQVWC